MKGLPVVPGADFVVKNERYAMSRDACYHATVEGAKAVGLRSLPR